MTKELICISCPRGCRLTAELQGDSWLITGNACPRGISYGQQELTAPMRVVTAVMHTDDPELPVIAVRTDRPCPREKIPGLLNRLYKETVKTPVKNGDIVWKIIDNSGISVIVTENI